MDVPLRQGIWRFRGRVYELMTYNWGPYSFEIYDDLELLHGNGLVERVPVPVKSWSKYRRTAAGDERVRILNSRAYNKVAKYLNIVKDAVTKEQTFNSLLRKIYRAYPECATKSLFRW